MSVQHGALAACLWVGGRENRICSRQVWPHAHLEGVGGAAVDKLRA